MIGPPFTLLIVVLAVTLFVLRLISIEERYLANAHGQDYVEYRRIIPRLIPTLRRIPAGADPRPPKWADALSGEVFHTSQSSH